MFFHLGQAAWSKEAAIAFIERVNYWSKFRGVAIGFVKGETPKLRPLLEEVK